MIKALEYCANAVAGMEIRNEDGTYTQISHILREAADMLAKMRSDLKAYLRYGHPKIWER